MGEHDALHWTRHVVDTSRNKQFEWRVTTRAVSRANQLSFHVERPFVSPSLLMVVSLIATGFRVQHYPYIVWSFGEASSLFLLLLVYLV